MSSSSLGALLHKYYQAYLPPVLWAGLIFYLSHQSTLPGFTVSIFDFLFKKTAHMFVYAVLYLLLYRAFRLTRPQDRSKRSYLIPLALTLLYAISDEWHQSLIPGRHPNFVRDVGYDLLGATTVLLHQRKIL